MTGRKDDAGKHRYDLIPGYALDKLAEVYTIGANKYGDRNWEKGLGYGRVFAALMRHAWAWWRGQQNDPVDGQHHLSSVAWCAFALMEYEHKKTGNDDRPDMQSPRPDIRAGSPGRRADFDVVADHQAENVSFAHCEGCHSAICEQIGCTRDVGGHL